MRYILKQFLYLSLFSLLCIFPAAANADYGYDPGDVDDDRYTESCVFEDLDEKRNICIQFDTTEGRHQPACAQICTLPRYNNCKIQDCGAGFTRTQARPAGNYTPARISPIVSGRVFQSAPIKALHCRAELETQNCSLRGGTLPDGYNDACKTKFADCLAGRVAKPEDNFKTKDDCEVFMTAQSDSSLVPECPEIGAPLGSGEDAPLNTVSRQECLQKNHQACVQTCPECRGDVGGKPVRGAPTNYDGPIPDCAFSYSGCRNVNDLVQLLINAARILFGVIGTIALAFFIYGGVTIILSFGSPDKVKKGKSILGAAVIGIAISFSAYMLVGFILDTLGVSKEFDFRKVTDALTSWFV
ncbi:MAG: hypothetical protein HOE53_00735 [Candidatus Magasanikbacteria bacterium]|jgi:hypothetical protein|nr:hypothetical protein [Candidatus Magasanikbacteria bacterium]